MYSVLIVDDAEIVRRSIKRSKLWGEDTGFFVTDEAGDGVEALEKLKGRPVDLIITDIKMPNMDGIELLERIDAEKLCPYVVLLSDFTEYRYARKGILHGAFDYIGKPMNDCELDSLLKRIKNDIAGKNTLYHNADVQITDRIETPRIRCFGRFEFSVGEHAVKFSTYKARELFAYLISNQHRQISRAELIENLFSSGDEKKDLNNLRVTIYRIRQALLAANIRKDHILIEDDFSVRVAPDICDIADFFSFVKENKVIERSNITAANKVIASMRGEFLSDLDAVWAADIRSFIDVEAENLLIKMAIYYNYVAYKPLKAEYLLIKLIEHNPLSEQGHLALLDLCIKTNNKGKYVYYYRRYRESLKNETDSAPEEKYKILYDKFSR